MALPKIRTIKEAYNLIIEADPNTSITYFNFRRIVLSGNIPFFKSGNRYLLNYSDVEDYFQNQNYLMPIIEPATETRTGTIRKIRA